MGAVAAVRPLLARGGHHSPAQDVTDPVAALGLSVRDAVQAAHQRVVTGQPRGHGQQLLQSAPPQAGIRVGGQMVGQQLLDGLVQAPQLPSPRAMPTRAETKLLVTERLLWPSLAVTPCQYRSTTRFPWRTTSTPRTCGELAGTVGSR